MKQLVAIILSVCIAATALSAAVSLIVCVSDRQKPLPLVPRSDPEPFALPAFHQNIAFTFELSEETTTAPVYKIVGQEVDRGYARSLAERFGFVTEPQYSEESPLGMEFGAGGFTPCYHVEEPPNVMDVQIDGTILFLSRAEPSSDASANVLGDEEAMKRAVKDYLLEMDLLPAGVEVSDFYDLSSRGAVVVFRHPGVRSSIGQRFTITVRMDRAGELMLLYHALPTLVLLGEYPVLSESAASQQVKTLGLYVDFFVRDVGLSSVELLYQTATSKEGVRFLVPCYGFSGDDVTSACVPALPDEYRLPPEEGGQDRDQ